MIDDDVMAPAACYGSAGSCMTGQCTGVDFSCACWCGPCRGWYASSREALVWLEQCRSAPQTV